MRRFRSVLAVLVAFPLTVGTAAASIFFPDVPVSYVHYQAIEALVNAGVIDGNPDGTFQPEQSVNRAAFLKMLYKAKGKVPDPSSVRCFRDVIPESWYESFVCDAAANGFVNGYPDGNFRPAQEVNRVEALKMIMTVFGIDVQEISSEAKDVVKFVDVSTSAWYTKYLYAAYVKRILPIPGQEGARFFPESALLRGEAAAYIYNALNVELFDSRSSSSHASSEQVSSGESERAQSEGSEQSSSAANELSVSFPFETSGKFDEKKPFSYVFDIDTPTTAFTEITASTGKVSCRLYLLEESGFSDEYFLGHQEGDSCFLQTALNAGSYQLQLQPTVAEATFTVSSAVKQGDGNDGFREANRLYKRTPQTAVLELDDLDDWYSFVVPSEESLTVEVTNPLEISCLVYAMADVDLFGFSGPECGKSYSYPPGTYYVAVSRAVASKLSRKTYTVQLR